MSAPRHPFWLGPASWLGGALVRALGATWRLRWIDTEERAAALARGERWIFALWHSRLLSLTYAHRDRDVAVLVSRHRDGELIARLVNRLGFVTPRGSSTRGGGEGALGMVRQAGEGRLLAITPDGPRGPARRVKPGLVYLASRTGLPVVPVAAAARARWTFRSWDGFQVPRPLAEVVIGYGEPLAVPAELDDAAAEAWRVRIETALEQLTRRMDALAEDPDRAAVPGGEAA